MLVHRDEPFSISGRRAADLSQHVRLTRLLQCQDQLVFLPLEQVVLLYSKLELLLSEFRLDLLFFKRLLKLFHFFTQNRFLTIFRCQLGLEGLAFLFQFLGRLDKVELLGLVQTHGLISVFALLLQLTIFLFSLFQFSRLLFDDSVTRLDHLKDELFLFCLFAQQIF